MKTYNALLIFGSLFFSVSAYAQSSVKPAPEMIVPNDKVDSVYNVIVKVYEKDSVFLNRLNASQELWKMLKDANLDMQFPEINKSEPLNVTYGSAVNECIPIVISKMNEERIKYLNQWLTGTPEGDVCRGSIKMTK